MNQFFYVFQNINAIAPIFKDVRLGLYLKSNNLPIYYKI
jgi:hypothetical protein